MMRHQNLRTDEDFALHNLILAQMFGRVKSELEQWYRSELLHPALEGMVVQRQRYYTPHL